MLKASSFPARFQAFIGRAGLLALLAATACTAPRGITTSGKVTPQGEFRVAYNQSFNVGTAPLSKAGSAVRDAASTLGDQAARGDTVRYSGAVTNVQAAALAYLLDPVQPAADFSLRYGVVPRLDVGYKYAFGSHVFDTQFQLLGPTGSVENPGRGAASGTTYASIGLQFATQRAKLPSLPFLSDINSLLNLRASRNDLLIPVIFSQSFGPEEEIGAISYGVVYAHSWVTYGFTPSKIYGSNNQIINALPTTSRNFSSFGGFVNLKLGYRYFYVIPAVSLFYQNYGEYALLNGASTSLSGLTVVPSLGFQLRIPTAASRR